MEIAEGMSPEKGLQKERLSSSNHYCPGHILDIRGVLGLTVMGSPFIVGYVDANSWLYHVIPQYN